MDTVSVGFSSTLGALFSLALDRLRYSHMYSTMGLLGILISMKGPGFAILKVLNVVPITIVTTGLYILNDVYDLEIDRISHPERALPSGDISQKAAKIASSVLMIGGTGTAFAINPNSGILIGTIAIFGVLYSVPPIRLRRFPVVPSMIIGFFVFLSFLAGYTSLGAPIEAEIILGGMLLWAMFIGCSLAKDLGDVQGDKSAGVNTLPTLLGFDKGFRITSIMVYSAFAFPIILIFVLDLPLFFIPLIAFLLLVEIFVLERFRNTRGEPESDRWYGLAFAQFVLVQISLIFAALV